ncbi:hypothetical protein BDQ17DRAFT_1320934 [Cyathus striatus]|nr:hypothetical protein BDQ17DRAFT_1320934 [Cyathus striatus]
MPPLSKQQPIIEIFQGPSRSRPYYVKHPPFLTMELLKPTMLTEKWPYMLAAGLFCSYLPMKHATNQEMLSSSVFRSIVRSVKEDPELNGHIGEAIRPQPE